MNNVKRFEKLVYHFVYNVNRNKICTELFKVSILGLLTNLVSK